MDGIDLVVSEGEIYGFLGTERRGQVNDRAHADDAAAADRRSRARRRLRRRQAGPQGAGGDRRRAAGGGSRPAAHGPRAPAPADGASRHLRGRAPAPVGRAAGAGWPRSGGRTEGQDVLGRDEAPPRPRTRARAPAEDPLPGRADDRPRSAVANGTLGRGRAARAGGRRHGLPHHAVPGGGRRARQPRRHHRPRAHRRRGHARRAEGRDRAPDGGGDPRRSRAAAAAGAGPRAVRRADAGVAEVALPCA